MRVIICGAGQVGYSIAAYLAREENEVTVIDRDPALVRQINDDLDVNSVLGNASTPDVLERAGAAEADMVIAVTHVDEVNMVACQVAHSLFNVPKKIARVRNQSYLETAWANLFSRAHMPIDVIISPEVEVAHAIMERLEIPGTTNIVTLADNQVHLVGVLCDETCPVLHTPIGQLAALFPDLPIEVSLIIRGQELIFPGDLDQLLPHDEVYFFTDHAHLRRALAAFGHEEPDARHICILGGGNIGLYLARLLRKNHREIEVRIIERDPARAEDLSRELYDVIVLKGDGLQREILMEANMPHADAMIAVTNDDETNILSSLLAKQYGCARAITLVNKPTYNTLVTSLGVDAVVSPRTSTVSTIMRYVRRGRIKALHTISDGLVEVIEAEISDSSALAHQKLDTLDLPENVMIGAIVRGKDVLMPSSNCTIMPLDHVVLLAQTGRAREVEQLFTVQVDIFN